MMLVDYAKIQVAMNDLHTGLSDLKELLTHATMPEGERRELLQHIASLKGQWGQVVDILLGDDEPKVL